MRPNRYTIDEDSASRLLQGHVHPDDAPPGYSAVAGLLNAAARLPVGPVDEDSATSTVSAMVEVIRDAVPAPQLSRRKAMLGKLLAGKALAAVAVVGLSATGAAAAATGSLPDQAQAVVADAADHVGLNIPHPNHGKSAAHRQDNKNKPKGDDEAPAGDDQDQPGEKPENNGQTTSTDAHNAKDAAKAAGEKVGPAVCAAVTEGKCQAGQHGQGSDSDDEGTPPAKDHGQSGEDHGKPEDVPAGSIDTGAEHSGRKVGPEGKGKPDTDQ